MKPKTKTNNEKKLPKWVVAIRARQEPKKAKFLQALAMLPSVKHACKTAGIDRTTIYKWRELDPEFSGRWRKALEKSVDAVEARAFELALCGTDRAAGRLIEFILRCHRPEVYRDRIMVGGAMAFASARLEHPDGEKLIEDKR